MENILKRTKRIEPNQTFKYNYSICTLVTKQDEYAEMVESFVNSGFTFDICEYIYADNSLANNFDGFSGLNRFISSAQGQYIIICHQDIIIAENTITDLDKQIDIVTKADPQWAILSNSGGVNLKYTAMHVEHGDGEILTEQNLPLKLQNVDESFILVKKEANLCLSADLNGFHLYGTDICLIANILGYTVYAIDFRFLHKSTGNADHTFYKAKKDLIKKYRRALRAVYIGTTITRFYISGTRFGTIFGNCGLVLFFSRQYYKVFWPKRKYHL
jgi:hypothetical protein